MKMKSAPVERFDRRVDKKLFPRSGGGFFFGVVVTLFLIVLTTQNTLVQAKRGCANFGHSCYGGMGKRANALTEEFLTQDTNGVEGSEQEDPALVFTGPRSVLRPMRTQFLQPRQQQYSDRAKMDFNGNANNMINTHGDLKMSPYLQQLLRYYKTLQNFQNQRDGPDGE